MKKAYFKGFLVILAVFALVFAFGTCKDSLDPPYDDHNSPGNDDGANPGETEPSGPTAITALNVNITIPVKNATPITTINGTGYNGTISWLPQHASFLGETVYTAKFTLTVVNGYTFTGLINSNIKMNGNSPADINISAEKVTFSYTFQQTDNRTVESILITSNPTKLIYTHGETLNMTGLNIKINYSDSTSISYSISSNNDFTQKGFSTIPALNTSLSHSTHNGQAVTIEYGGKSSKTANLTVNAIPPSAPQNLSVTPGNEQVTLSWIAPLDNGGSSITGYQVSINSSSTWNNINTTGTTPIIGTVTGLINGQSYTFQVRAQNTVGNSLASNTVTMIPHVGSGTSSDPFLVRNTGEWNTVLSVIRMYGSNKNHYIYVNGDVAVPSAQSGEQYSFGFNNTNVTVTLKGVGKLYLNTEGNFLSLRNHKLIIDSENLVLQGINNNLDFIRIHNGGTLELINGSIIDNGYAMLKDPSSGVVVAGGSFIMTGGNLINLGLSVLVTNGDFIMTGGNIIGVTSYHTTYGTGVIIRGGSFTMKGGFIKEHPGSGVTITTGGFFNMIDGTITGNTSYGNYSSGGGVSMSGGTFIMEGGNIIDNYLNVSSTNYANNLYGGGGVYIHSGSFTMLGGNISGNKASFGAGVHKGHLGSFTMEGGSINNNIALSLGGGVYIHTDTSASNSLFTMKGGEIANNTAGSGGGVFVGMISSPYIVRANFIMSGGIISGNTANNDYGSGGGVSATGSNFTKTGNSIVYGNDAALELRNTVTSSFYLNPGHAVFNYSTRYRDTTLGVNDDISTDSASGWNQ